MWGAGGAAGGNTAPGVGKLKGPFRLTSVVPWAVVLLWPPVGTWKASFFLPRLDFVDRLGQLLRLMHGQLLGEPQNARVQKQGL